MSAVKKSGTAMLPGPHAHAQKLINTLDITRTGVEFTISTEGLVVAYTKPQSNPMSGRKQFGVWMDTHHATIISKDEETQGQFTVVAHVKGETDHGNSNEQNANNHARTLTAQFFKEIAAHMPNADVLHITGTGQIQEEFAHYLADTPQYKDTITSDSTSNKMSDEALLKYFAERLT